MSENSQLNKTYALLKEVYGPLENLSQTQWSQIERGVKALMKEHGPDIPLESLKAKFALTITFLASCLLPKQNKQVSK